MKKLILTIAFFTFCLYDLAYASKVTASSYGYNSTDATTQLASAFSQDVDTLIIDNPGVWITGPVTVSNRTGYVIIFRRGAILRAKTGYTSNQSLLKFTNCTNITIVGWGGELKMNKGDGETYGEGDQFRHCLFINGCTNVKVKGLKITGSGGDGISVGPYSTGSNSDQVTITGCTISNHNRQGISVTACTNFLIEHCEIFSINGTDPSCGIDLEPYSSSHKIRGSVRNVRIANCTGYGITLGVGESNQQDHDVTVEDVYVDNCIRGGLRVVDGYFSDANGANTDVDLCDGTVVFRRVYTRNCPGPGLYIKKPANRLATSFINCVWENCNNNTSNPTHYGLVEETAVKNGIRIGPFDFVHYFAVPQSIPERQYLAENIQSGGVTFTTCSIWDDEDRPWLYFFGQRTVNGKDYMQSLANVTGSIALINSTSGTNKAIYVSTGLTSNVTVTKTDFSTFPSTTINFSTNDNSSAENSTNDGIMRMTRTASNTSWPIPIKYSVSGTASNRLDYAYINTAKIITSASTTADVLINALADDVSESTESSTITLVSNSRFYTDGSTKTSTVNITNSASAYARVSVEEEVPQ
ncbi:MAG: right-handed parallel beta-helix repeat-containing protein, partial [Leadbetterella sp.]